MIAGQQLANVDSKNVDDNDDDDDISVSNHSTVDMGQNEMPLEVNAVVNNEWINVMWLKVFISNCLPVPQQFQSFK